MSDLIWLSEAQMRRIEPYFPLSHGVPRVDDRRIISGIIFVIRNGLRWRDAPVEYPKADSPQPAQLFPFRATVPAQLGCPVLVGRCRSREARRMAEMSQL